ncbi:hypothetical protein P7C70_g9204, partial [Phenoliferia sp. Uapishka_3]
MPKCSQCRLDLPPSSFPLRAASLTPYSVCSNHEWYWSDKKHLIYTPGTFHTLPQVASELVARLADGAGMPTATGEEGAGTMVWVVEGKEEDRQAIVDAIAGPAGWSTKYTKARKSRAISAHPPPTSWNYTFDPPPPSHSSSSTSSTYLPALKVTMTLSEVYEKWSVNVTVKQDVESTTGKTKKVAKAKKEEGAAAKWDRGLKRVRADQAEVDDYNIQVNAPPAPVVEPPPTPLLPATRLAFVPPPPRIKKPNPSLAFASPRPTIPIPAPAPPRPVEEAAMTIMEVLQASLAPPPSTSQSEPRPPTKRVRSFAAAPPAPSQRTPPRSAASSSSNRQAPHHVPLNHLRPLPANSNPMSTFPSPNTTLNAYDPSLSLSYSQSPTGPASLPFSHPSNPYANPYPTSASQYPTHSTSSQPPLTLFQLLDSPFLSPPTLLPHLNPRYDPSKSSRRRPPVGPRFSQPQHPPPLSSNNTQNSRTRTTVTTSDAADFDLNSEDSDIGNSTVIGGSDEESSDEESDDEDGETEGEFINDEDETGWEEEGEEGDGDEQSSEEGESSEEGSSEEGESEEEEEEGEGDWLEGFVKGQLGVADVVRGGEAEDLRAG